MEKDRRLEFIGVAGVNGSGKDTVGEMLAAHHGYLFISVTDLLRNEAKRRAVAPEREMLRTISSQWRQEWGLGALVDKAIAEYEIKKEEQNYQGVVMASIRNPGEVDRIHEAGGIVIWLDANPRVRYDRIQKSAAERNRASEDNMTFEQFLADEDIEMNPPAGSDDTVLNMSEVKKKCDVLIINDSNNLDLFRKMVEASLRLN